MAPPINPTLNVHSGSGSGRTSPPGEDIQGPSPVDYNIELEAEFSKEMVIEMQMNAAKKARRTMIGRTLRGRASFKTLQESLKLHLPASFISTTLLTKGFFLILFKNEEGATATRKLATVEWGGLILSFSRYNPNFDANAQGAEALLTHAIKVQFPDLHEQFRNERTLTIMASKLGEVLEIEAADSYIKRPADLMVTIEVKDIAKLAGFIRIRTMVEGTAFTDTIRQKILYSGLPNQCRKCRRFGHQARTCNIVRNLVQEGVAHKAPVPREADNKHPRMRPSAEVAPRVREQSSSAVPRHEVQAPGTYQGGATSKLPRNRTSAPSPGEDLSKARPSNPPPTRNKGGHQPESRRFGQRPTPRHCQAGQRKEPRLTAGNRRRVPRRPKIASSSSCSSPTAR